MSKLLLIFDFTLLSDKTAKSNIWQIINKICSSEPNWKICF